jgi:hypothetical protein
VVSEVGVGSAFSVLLEAEARAAGTYAELASSYDVDNEMCA